MSRLALGNKSESLAQFIKFCIVGVSNTVVAYFLNIGILFLLRDAEWRWDYIFANVTSFTLSIFWAFYWNNKYVFKEKPEEERNKWKALGKTFLSYGFTGYILNNILLFVLVDMFGMSKYIAPLVTLIISVPVNFLLNKLWAFCDSA
jgi:putative flippase GtrA